MTQTGTYPTGTYVNKDGQEKVALTARAAVALVFDGYSLKQDAQAAVAEPAVEIDEEVEDGAADDEEAPEEDDPDEESIESFHAPVPTPPRTRLFD